MVTVGGVDLSEEEVGGRKGLGAQEVPEAAGPRARGRAIAGRTGGRHVAFVAPPQNQVQSQTGSAATIRVTWSGQQLRFPLGCTKTIHAPHRVLEFAPRVKQFRGGISSYLTIGC